ncbi:vWA domain-containing protein [Intestinimonas butyriciproducens]|uniref:vWA domain-containing protein n=1 Tax=Intestinimonas butyriciproducens TaxID=1297617 RepID=UPI0018A00F8D|nr:vWA domain-containing protein [Intestinimonas butyriciproducens]
MDKRRILAAALTAVMLLGMLPAALAAEPQPTEAADELGITLLKTAGALNSVRETKISLEISAPVNETPVAVEFVMDATSSLFSSGDEIMIQSWAEEIRGAMADKNVYAGLTVFANDAKTVYEMSQLTAESTFDYSLGEEMLWLAGHTGTNLQAGIRAGLADLEKAPDTIPQANRYLVLITDGGSFWWLDDAGNPANDTYNDGTRLQNNDAAEGGYESLTDLTALLGQTVSAQPAAYTAAGDEALADVVGQIKTSGALTNFEKGVYFAAKELDKVTEAGVRLITVRYPYYADEEGLSALTTLAGQLMDYAERKSVFTASPASLEETAAELESVMDQIYGGGVNVVVPAGSTITDVIGKDEDYDFDLSIKSKEIPALADFALKIGGDAPMEGQLDENNQITFAGRSAATPPWRGSWTRTTRSPLPTVPH